LLFLLLAGCSESGKGAATSPGGDDTGDPGDDGPGDPGDDGGLPPGDAPLPELVLNATTLAGDLPLLVNFTFDASDQGADAGWAMDFGDAEDASGSGLPGYAEHTYTVAGVFTATLNVTFASGESDERNLTVTVTVPEDGDPAPPPPDPTTFTFGPSAGCVTEHGQCTAGGPSADGVLGHWQAFDFRYWGYTATVTEAGNVLNDTDCRLYAPDATTMLADGSNVDQPCSAVIPEGTGWIFINSWAEPSTGMTLEITPTEA
jgi:PKD repeat protein